MIIIIARAMRYPTSHKQETRERIVKAAARRFRSRGGEGAGIGTMMRDLRLTHGGFYRHFDSKEALFAAAFEHGLQDLRRRFSAAVEQAPRGGELKALIDAYLDVEHCDHTAAGCPVAALGAEIARRPRVARAPFQRVLGNHLRLIAKYLPGANDETRERKAMMLFSGMAGTLTVARVMTDDRRRRQLLDAAKGFYLGAANR
jgi:TetR/AcrR family transcriptional regulator, transcriptional repressor for nem operon